MPLKRGSSRKVVEANFDELRHGKTFARTAKKFGKRRAEKQMVAIALETARKTGRSMSDGR
jgi:1,2-phenylacetyl-CoA epoxidase catalytic subunit